jgi:hypothetical protein
LIERGIEGRGRVWLRGRLREAIQLWVAGHGGGSHDDRERMDVKREGDNKNQRKENKGLRM